MVIVQIEIYNHRPNIRHSMNFAYRILSALGWIWLIAAGIFLYIRLRSPKTPPPPGGQTQA